MSAEGTGAAPSVRGSREQVARLLRIVPHLERGFRLDEAAAEFGVTEAQLMRDLKVLYMCGLPGLGGGDMIEVNIEALTDTSGDRVIRVENADYLTRPLRLTPTEATALIVALRALRTSAEPATVEIVDRALGKIEGASAAALPPIHEGEQPSFVSREVAVAVRDALAAGKQLELQYFVPARDEETSRTVDPRAVVERQGAQYLDAWCHQAEAPRTFRMDRIRSARVLEADVVTEPAEEPVEFLAATQATRVTLRLDAEARWVPEYYAHQAVRELADGGLEVDLDIADPQWLTRLLLRLAPHATVVAPVELAAGFTDHLRRLRESYGIAD